jgi:hypothetical protein
MHRLSTQVAAVALDPIQMLWVRGDLSRMERLSLRSFLAQGHPVMLYTYDSPGNVPGGVEVRDAREIVDEKFAPTGDKPAFGKGTYGAFSDFFRYSLLHKKGGWWADLDVVAIRPWASFPDVVAASTSEKDYGRIANGFVMRFPAGHDVMEKCLHALKPERLPHMGIDETGPLLLHRILGRAGVEACCQAPHVFGPVPWNASWQLLRTWRDRISIGELKQRIRRPHLSMQFRSDTAAIHLWNEMWKNEGIDKHAKKDPSCLYEKLQRQFNSDN